MFLGPGLLTGVTHSRRFAAGGLDCMVETSEGEVELTREEAQLATTAVALLARGAEAPATSNSDDAVLQRLADGPPEDAGSSLTCRGSGANDLQEQQLTGTGLTPRV
jgi:hypothetical protein